VHDADFASFVIEKKPALVRTAYLLCGDWHQAEDLVQNVLVRLYPKWRRVSEAGDPTNYVKRSLLNAVVDERRRPWRRERPVAAHPESSGLSVNDVTDSGGHAMQALQSVPLRQRTVIVLRYLEGMSVAEVAVELRISEGTVKSQAARGLAAMRSALESHNQEIGR
jgi:RNA polymerase sigma-70 factor (sigma-E family)